MKQAGILIVYQQNYHWSVTGKTKNSQFCNFWMEKVIQLRLILLNTCRSKWISTLFSRVNWFQARAYGFHCLRVIPIKILLSSRSPHHCNGIYHGRKQEIDHFQIYGNFGDDNLKDTEHVKYLQQNLKMLNKQILVFEKLSVWCFMLFVCVTEGMTNVQC